MRWLDITLVAVTGAFSIIAPVLNFEPLSHVLYARPPGVEPPTTLEIVQIAMQIILTFAFVGASLYIILSRSYDDGTYKWAFGMSGSVFGFWFSSVARKAQSAIHHGKTPSKRRKTK